ncbi:hypothetical protein J2S70_000289 [Trueperella bonasi]|uniref:DUF2617 family protein n=1 Tax=Trueperella bonasi TaxID=312286 RepID=A0ABT9NET5_9ACTO|nr:hypothetical protein [Trueperella bonasi]MDP9805707.1 hypothetical protein [Trueperella bonasi]
MVSDFQDEVPCSSTEPIRAAFHRIADVPQIKVTVSCAVLLGDITWLSAAEFLERTKGEFSFHIECGYVGGIVETNSVMIENFEGVTEIEDPGTHWHRAARSVDFCEALCRISDCELRDIYSAIEEENIPGVIQTIDTPTCMHLAGNIYGLEINDSGMTMVNFTHTQAEVVFAQYQPPQISRQYSG